MADEQIEKTRRIGEASGLAEDLQAMRKRLAEPGVSKAIAAMTEARAKPVRPGPSRVTLPETSRIDHSEMDRLAKVGQEGLRTIRDGKRDREQRMIQTLEGVRAELTASGKREAKALERAEAAEDSNAFMRKTAVASLAVAVLALVISVLH